jgi:hypothetical protein
MKSWYVARHLAQLGNLLSSDKRMVAKEAEMAPMRYCLIHPKRPQENKVMTITTDKLEGLVQEYNAMSKVEHKMNYGLCQPNDDKPCWYLSEPDSDTRTIAGTTLRDAYFQMFRWLIDEENKQYAIQRANTPKDGKPSRGVDGPGMSSMEDRLLDAIWDEKGEDGF